MVALFGSDCGGFERRLSVFADLSANSRPNQGNFSTPYLGPQ